MSSANEPRRQADELPSEIRTALLVIEKSIETFDNWAFEDPGRGIAAARTAFALCLSCWSLARDIPLKKGMSWDEGMTGVLRGQGDLVRATVEGAAAGIKDLMFRPLASLTGIDPVTLRDEVNRLSNVKRQLLDLFDIVRDRIQKDFVFLRPGDWVRDEQTDSIGTAAVVKNCQVRLVTAAEERVVKLYSSRLQIIQTPPVPPFCLSGSQFFREALLARDELERLRSGIAADVSAALDGAYRFVRAVTGWCSLQVDDVLCPLTVSDSVEQFAAVFSSSPVAVRQSLMQILSLAERVGRTDAPSSVAVGDFESTFEEISVLEDAAISALASRVAELVANQIGATVWIEVPSNYEKVFEADHFSRPIKQATIEGRSGRTIRCQTDLNGERAVFTVDVTSLFR